MTRLLALLLGRLPVGWLQLVHNPARMAAALAGVIFANVLVFVQLGMLGALNRSIDLAWSPFRADAIISSTDADTLTDGSPLARRLMWRALAVPGVAAAAPLYVARLDWERPGKATAALTAYGLPPEAGRFAAPALRDRLPLLALPDRVLIDDRARGTRPAEMARIGPATPLRFEANGRTLEAPGTFRLGGSFFADGALLMSDQTFLTLYPARRGGTPSHILLDLAPGADPARTIAAVAEALAGEPVKVRSLAAAKAEETAFQTTRRPVGLIFGFGVGIGILVGIVIVYQVLSTDVADHLREYATFKAMGYPHGFFLGIVFEEALALALIGFGPGLLLALLVYALMAQATGLPVEMTPARAVSVFLGTVAACMVSGALAARRLRGADPAELF